MNEILLRADTDTIRQCCFVNTYLYQLCTSEHFWQQKLIYDKLPNIIFNKVSTLESMAVSRDEYNKIELWLELYINMHHSHKEAQGIVMINQFEKYTDVNMGTIKISLSTYYAYGTDGVRPIIPDIIVDRNYIPDRIEIKILKQHYELMYVIYDCDTHKDVQLLHMIDETEVVRILTLILFDFYILSNNIDIVNIKGETLMDQDDSEYMRGVWAIINWQNNIKYYKCKFTNV